MKCPFELPVKAETSIVDSDSRYITTETHTYICGDISSEEYADYIVTAINAYDSMKEFIENTDNTESYREWCNCNKETGNKQ